MVRLVPRDDVRRGALVVGVGLLLVACGDDADPGATGEVADAAEEDDPDAGAAGEEGDGDGEDPAPEQELTSEDGWNGPADGDPPADGGLATLRIEGMEVDLELECSLQVSDENYLLFDFSAVGEGETDDGRRLTASASRRILSVDEAATSVYDYKGQESGTLQVTVDAPEEGQMHSSIVVSPADDDTTGSHLPVVRVGEDGTFSASHDLEAMMSHDTALTGPAELVGRCPDGWDSEAA